MYKDRQIVLHTEYYKIVSEIISYDDINKLLSKSWRVFPKYKKKFHKEKNAPPVLDEHEEERRDLIGIFRFSENPENGRVVLTYEKVNDLKPWLLVEIINKICQWAFSQQDVYSIQMNITDYDLKENLLKVSFKEEDGGLVLHKEVESQIITCMGIGLSLGLVLGGCYDIIIIGMLIGIAVGYFIGRALDKRERIHRRIIEKKEK